MARGAEPETAGAELNSHGFDRSRAQSSRQSGRSCGLPSLYGGARHAALPQSRDWDGTDHRRSCPSHTTRRARQHWAVEMQGSGALRNFRSIEVRDRQHLVRAPEAFAPPASCVPANARHEWHQVLTGGLLARPCTHVRGHLQSLAIGGLRSTVNPLDLAVCLVVIDGAGACSTDLARAPNVRAAYAAVSKEPPAPAGVQRAVGYRVTVRARTWVSANSRLKVRRCRTLSHAYCRVS